MSDVDLQLLLWADSLVCILACVIFLVVVPTRRK